jgi:hypothetical protein
VEEVKTGPEITGKDLLFKAAAMAMRDAGREGVTLDYEDAIKQASKIYGIPYKPSQLPQLRAQLADLDRRLAPLIAQQKLSREKKKQAKYGTAPAAPDVTGNIAPTIDRIKPATKSLEETETELAEDLKKWFKEKWVRFGPDGKIRGDCARGSSKEGKPKCLPQSKAHALGKKGRASAAAKKRREDPNAERRGPAKNVATKVGEEVDASGGRMYQAKEKFLLSRNGKQIAFYDSIIQAQKDAERMQKELGGEVVVQRVMREQELDEKQDACYRKVKSRYKVWPSAYASGALVQCRKKGAANWGNKKK